MRISSVLHLSVFLTGFVKDEPPPARARTHTLTPVTGRFFDGRPLRKHPLDDSTSRGVGLSNHQGGKYRLQSSFTALHECHERDLFSLFVT